MKKLILSATIATLMSTSAFAGNTDNNWENSAKDAWIDGKAEATLLFNGNLDSFDINTDVEDGVITLTGKVENAVDKRLAGELVSGLDGVTKVKNMLTVMAETEDSISDDLLDTKIATVVKSKLLFDTEVSGSSIDVDVKNKEVTLKGKVASDAEKQLALQITKNTDDVESVIDELFIDAE